MNQDVTCVSLNQEATFVSMGMAHGFAIFGVDPFRELYRRSFHSSEEISVPPRFLRNPIEGSAIPPSSAPGKFRFQSVKMLHDTNLVALVGSGDQSVDSSACTNGFKMHYTRVFNRHKVVIWDIRTDSIFIDIDVHPYASLHPGALGITGLEWFRDGFKSAPLIRPSQVPVDDPCNWPADIATDPVLGAHEDANAMSLKQLEAASRRIPAQPGADVEGLEENTFTSQILQEAMAQRKPIGNAMHHASITFHRLQLDARGSMEDFDTIGGRQRSSKSIFEEAPELESSIFRIRVLVATHQSGVFAFTIEGATQGLSSESIVYQVAAYQTSPNLRGLGSLRSVELKDTGVASNGLFLAMPATSMGCIRVAFAAAVDEPSPTLAGTFIEAHAPQKRDVGIIATTNNCESGTGTASERMRRTFLLASASNRAHSVHVYRVAIVPDSSSPPALVSAVKILELRRAYANNPTLATTGVVEEDRVACLVFSPSDTHLAVISTIGVVQIFAVAGDTASQGSATPNSGLHSSQGGSSTDGDARTDSSPAFDGTAGSTPTSGSSGIGAGIASWGSWIGNMVATGVQTTVSTASKMFDHEKPIVTMHHNALRVDSNPGDHPGALMQASFSTESTSLLLHVVTVRGIFVTFDLDLYAKEPSGTIRGEPYQAL